MKHMGYISKVFQGLMLLFALSMNCCDHNCETCRLYDQNSGQLQDEITACDQGMINNLRSKDYKCR